MFNYLKYSFCEIVIFKGFVTKCIKRTKHKMSSWPSAQFRRVKKRVEKRKKKVVEGRSGKKSVEP